MITTAAITSVSILLEIIFYGFGMFAANSFAKKDYTEEQGKNKGIRLTVSVSIMLIPLVFVFIPSYIHFGHFNSEFWDLSIPLSVPFILLYVSTLLYIEHRMKQKYRNSEL